MFGKIGAVERGDQRGPLMLSGRDDEDLLAAGAGERLRRDPAETAVAPSGLARTGDQEVLRVVRQRGEPALEQRHVDVLTFTAADITVMQCGEDRVDAIEAGE